MSADCTPECSGQAVREAHNESTPRTASRADTCGTQITVYDTRASALFPSGAAIERLCTGAVWGEGPVWISEHRTLLWSDIPNNRMLRWSERDGMSVWRDNVEFTNGHTRERDGSILHCSHGQRAIVRTRLRDGLRDTVDEVVVDRFLGKRLNSPNDIVVKSDGTIWFTDPPYGIVSDREGHAAPSELGDNYVFRHDPRTGILAIASDFVEEGNSFWFATVGPAS